MIKKIIRKISNRAQRTIRSVYMNHISFNQQYRPVGIKKLRVKHPGVELTEINQAHTSVLDLDPKFVQDCAPPDVKPVITVQYPNDYIATITNGRILACDINNFAVISGDNYLLDEASFQWQDALVEAEKNVVFQIKGFTKPKKYAGRVFSLLTLGATKHYYYHWMFDALPKLHLLKKSGMFDAVDYFLVPNYQYPFNKEYLNYFNIPESKIINEEIEHHVQADFLMVCSLIRREDHLPRWACDFFYNSFVKSINDKTRGKSIYIARGDAAKSRKVNNESALIAMLESQGFEICYLSRISVLEQVNLFNSASLIVAVHGGGLSNLVYCEPGTTLLEIFPDQYVRHYFYDICTKRGISYDYILCESDKPCANHFEGEAVGLTVDVEAVRVKVNGLKDQLSLKSSNGFA